VIDTFNTISSTKTSFEGGLYVTGRKKSNQEIAHGSDSLPILDPVLIGASALAVFFIKLKDSVVDSMNSMETYQSSLDVR